ncbi:MAG: hypothetical protein ABI691_01015 [Ginsengibacter sp.]
MSKKKTIYTNCERATFLIEKQHASHLSPSEWIGMKIHLAFCSVCRIYKKQSSMINQVAYKLFHANANTPFKLDDASKKEMQHRINEKIQKK